MGIIVFSPGGQKPMHIKSIKKSNVSFFFPICLSKDVSKQFKGTKN